MINTSFSAIIKPIESHQWEQRGSEACEDIVPRLQILHWCLPQAQSAYR